MKRATPRRRTADRKARLYAAMVAAVRAWVHEAHPDADRIGIMDWKLDGEGKPLANFHALHPDDPYTQGDDAAFGPDDPARPR